MADVTISEIAQRLGFSNTAISLALRGRPGVGKESRVRILQLAKELGYVPNPVSAELMELVRAKRHNTGSQTIAFINTFKDPTLLHRIDGLILFVKGARERAARYGYSLEVFEARARGMTPERLASILQARGIRGVLLGPRWGAEPDLDFPWGRFAVVLVGEPESGPSLHRVCNHHIHGSATIMRNLAAKGYRNIGLILIKEHEEKFGYDYMLGAEQFLRTADNGVKVTTWVCEKWSDEEGEAWINRHGFDAVVSLDGHPGDLCDRLRATKGVKIGYANLGVVDGATWSGIDQHTEDIGAASVDLLRNLLIGGERGTVPRPRVLLVEGEWVERETTPGTLTAQAAETAVKAVAKTVAKGGPKGKRGAAGKKAAPGFR